MSSFFPNGSQFAISGALEAAKTVTAISNANPGVASAASHGYANGDILVQSANGLLDLRVARAANIATGTYELEGIDTTSTARYPTGFGVGTVRRAGTATTGFTTISQIDSIEPSGGEQQFKEWSYVDDPRSRQRPTRKTARKMKFTMDYDPALAWHAALLTADQDAGVRVLRIVLPDSSKLFYSVYVSFDGQPALQQDDNMKVVAEFALACPDLTRYAT
jgi:hypothetical protein